MRRRRRHRAIADTGPGKKCGNEAPSAIGKPPGLMWCPQVGHLLTHSTFVLGSHGGLRRISSGTSANRIAAWRGLDLAERRLSQREVKGPEVRLMCGHRRLWRLTGTWRVPWLLPAKSSPGRKHEHRKHTGLAALPAGVATTASPVTSGLGSPRLGLRSPKFGVDSTTPGLGSATFGSGSPEVGLAGQHLGVPGPTGHGAPSPDSHVPGGSGL